MQQEIRQAYCTECGAPLKPSDRYCERCGARTVPREPSFRQPMPGMPNNRINKKTDVFCIAGIVLSWYAVFSYIFAPVFSIGGIIVSILGLQRVERSGEDGKSLAVAGIAIGAVGLIVYVLIVFGLIGGGAGVIHHLIRYGVQV
ncbi:MAG: DUF4190 domain-containing protein [Anaerofustis sp.]